MLLNFLASILALFSNEQKPQIPKLLLISFDGFRFDLLNETLVPSIYRWAKESTWFTSGSRSQYVTITSPNHMGIVTGLYNENHGIVGNHFYDMEHGKMFDYYNSSGLPGIVNASLDPIFFTNSDPIWNLNERSNGFHRSSAFYWPFAEAKFPKPPHKPQNFRPWEFYGNITNWLPDVDRIIDEFTKESPSNFIAWYVEEPDHNLHMNGFYNGELQKVMRELDFLFSSLLAKLEAKGIRDKVNIILTADHGHAQIIDYDHYMCLRDFLPDDTLWADQMIYPRNESHAKWIYKTLTKAVEDHKYQVKVYLKENFPEKYRYKRTEHTARIILEPEVGSVIMWCKTSDINRSKPSSHSTHGQSPDRPEMRSALVMSGPAFLSKKTIAEIPNNIDLFPLMCAILEIETPPNNGTLDVVREALINPPPT